MLRIGILVIGVVLGMNLSGQNTQFYVNENGDITHFDTLDFKDIPINTPGIICLLYTSPSPRDRTRSRMPSSA